MQTLIAGYHPIFFTLSPHESYQLFVQVENLKNEVQYELQENICKNIYCIIYILLLYLDIATYFVQDFSVAKNWDNGSVTIELQWRTGCGFIMPKVYVVFDDKTQRLKKSFNITSEETQLVTLSRSGNYSISVFDIYNGSLFGPAFELQEIQIDIPIITCMSFQMKLTNYCLLFYRFNECNSHYYSH